MKVSKEWLEWTEGMKTVIEQKVHTFFALLEVEDWVFADMALSEIETHVKALKKVIDKHGET